MPLWGVVGGSGLSGIPGLEITESVSVATPYGDPSGLYSLGIISGREVAFLPRHGAGHTIQPHRINYRANLWGFRELGVRRILSVGASGGISRDMIPGAIALPDQVMDMTSGREATFYDKDEVVHIDFTDPFCPDLRQLLLEAARRTGIDIIPAGTYICVNGPRLETAAEIRTYAAWGADMVGMTAMPETVLARELEMCFASLSVVTNRAAGISDGRLTVSEVIGTMRSSMDKIRDLLSSFFMQDTTTPACPCGRALKDAGM